MKALLFQHQNAVCLHVETVHADGRLTLSTAPGARPFITCAQTTRPRIGYAQILPDPPPPPDPAPLPPPEEAPED